MTSKHSIERRIDSLDSSLDSDGPDEIIITDCVVSECDEEAVPETRIRVWRDGTGEWHSEQVFTQSDSQGIKNDVKTIN